MSAATVRLGPCRRGSDGRALLRTELVSKPSILFLDEPTSGLDAALKADLIDLFLLEGPRPRATLLISHDIPVILRSCTRVYVMLCGEIVESISTERLVQEATHPYTRSLLASAGLSGRNP